MMRVLLFGLALPAVTWACTCTGNAPPCAAAWKSSAVFAGTVVELSRQEMQPNSRGEVQVNGFLGTHVTFEVAEAFIGMEGLFEAGGEKRIELRTGMGGGDCGYPFRRGESYLVYAYKNED